MKKMLTICFALMAAVVMNAETTTTLWEGSETATWEKRIEIPCDWTTVSEGDVLTFTAVTEGNAETYATFHLLSAAWKEVVTKLSFPYEEGATKTCTFTMTAVALDSALNAGGLGVQGFGFTLKKIELTTGKTPEPAVEDLADSVLWTGEQTIDGWGANCLALNDSAFIATFKGVYTRAANMYILVEGGTNPDLRIAGGWGEWNATAYPADGYNHMGAKDEDGVVKVELTMDFINKATTDNKGFFIWGNGGFVVKAIGTTKAAVMNAKPTALETVRVLKNGVRYNLLGQEVNEYYKGIVILDGKKMLVK